MPRVTFIRSDGTEQTVDVPVGTSVMQAALQAEVPGIVGECSGCASCATCKVEVSRPWSAKLDPISDLELSLIEDEPGEVRLSCQIKMSPGLDGLVVKIPASQYR